MVIQVLSDEAVEGHKKLGAECAGVVKYRLTRENFMSPHDSSRSCKLTTWHHNYNSRSSTQFLPSLKLAPRAVFTRTQYESASTSLPTTNPPAAPHQTLLYSYHHQPGNPSLHPRGISTSSPSHQKFAQSYTNTSLHPQRPSTATATLAAPHRRNSTTTAPVPIPPTPHTHAPTSTPPSTSPYCSYPAIHTLRPFTCTTPLTRSNYAAPGDYSTS